MQNVVETFRACNKSGDGLISYGELSVLLRTVDPGITEDNFQLMMDETGAEGNDQMKFEEFAAWLNGDSGPPAIIKAGQALEKDQQKGAEAEEDEEQSVDDEGDADRLAADVDLAIEGLDLDLDRRVTRLEWLAIMSEMDIDTAEANELFDNVTEDCVKEGLGTPETGFPLNEFLQEMKVEISDVESLKEISRAAAAAKAKGDSAKAKGDSPESFQPDDPRVLKAALDRLVRELDKARRPADDAWAIFEEGAVPLTKIQTIRLGSFAGRKDELVAKVKEVMVSPPLVNACAGQHACRELCMAEFDKILERCKAEGKPFTDPEWDMGADLDSVLYVNKKCPGWDCTVGKPAGVKRLTEIIKDPVLFKGGLRAIDINQGQIGTCFLLGAIGAVAVNNESSLRKVFLKHDVEAGLYAIRFCLDGEWTYTIVDDMMPVDQYGRLMYAHGRDPQEVWVPILEKAYCKLHTCYEMCDGGFSTEAIYNFFGGVSGRLPVTEAHQKDPESYFAVLKQARSRGWLLTCHFAPKKGAMGGAGKCGEATFDSGLVGGHCYSILKVVKACGHLLIFCRNPWGTGEWKGMWSDKNEHGEWTEEMKEAAGKKFKNDGCFTMSIQDFLANVGDVRYARPFGPHWKKLTQYKYFQKGSMLATAKFSYPARAGDELSIEKGCSVEVKALSAGWWYGKNVADGKEGYFPGNYVRLNDRPVARFDLVGTRAEGVDLMTVVVLLLQPDCTRERKFYKRKEDGLDYKDTSYPCIQLCVVNPDGKVHAKKRAKRREVWVEMKIPGGEGWRIYAYSVDGTGSRFVLRAYVKDGTITMTEVSGVQISEMQAAIAKR